MQFAEFSLPADVSALLWWLHNSLTDIYQQELSNQEQQQRSSLKKKRTKQNQKPLDWNRWWGCVTQNRQHLQAECPSALLITYLSLDCPMGAWYQVPDSGMIEPNVCRGIYSYIMPGEIKALISLKGASWGHMVNPQDHTAGVHYPDLRSEAEKVTVWGSLLVSLYHLAFF